MEQETTVLMCPANWPKHGDVVHGREIGRCPVFHIKSYLLRLQSRIAELETENRALRQKVACPLRLDDCIDCDCLREGLCDWPHKVER